MMSLSSKYWMFQGMNGNSEIETFGASFLADMEVPERRMMERSHVGRLVSLIVADDDCVRS